MKNVLIILTFFFALSCKKECIKDKTQNKLHGKIKSIVEYSARDTLYFSFKYDSITAELTDVRLIPLNRLDTFFTLMTLTKLNDTTAILMFLDEEYTILFNNNQINTIKKTNLITGFKDVVCSINSHNGMVDSIHDEGSSSIFSTNINYEDFEYKNSNCLKYKINWIETVTGFPLQKSQIDSFIFSSIDNSHQFPIGDLYTLGSYIRFLGYYLQIGGYYYIQPNKKLISSINTTYENSIFVTKFDYTMMDNYVTKLKITMPDGGIVFRDIEYY